MSIRSYLILAVIIVLHSSSFTFAEPKPEKIGGKTPQQILKMLGAKDRDAVTDRQLESYGRIFGFMDTNRDGFHSEKEFIEDGRYLTRQARQGIFRASDSNNDKKVSKKEYIENRIITDEAKSIYEKMDTNKDGKLTAEEFSTNSKIKNKSLAGQVFTALDTGQNGELNVPEYLRTWGRWARSVSKKKKVAVQ
ncbi:MAG: hypothetical protein COA78_26535 [Blastopirellula sp.]|nr:MAG: hypothetical protein COA78_26535 [Blastopirellula sp.]